MKICVFARMLPIHYHAGGIELHTWFLCKELVKMGHDVLVLTGRHPSGIAYEKKEGIVIYYVGNKPTSIYPVSYWEESAKKLESLLEGGEKIDVIHSQSASAWYYVKRGLRNKYGIPLVSTFHGTPVSEIRTVVNTGLSIKSLIIFFIQIYLSIFVFFRFFRSSDVLIAINREIKRDLMRFFFINEVKINVILNGVDTRLFSSDIDSRFLAESYGINKKQKVLLTVGRVVEEKGFQYLIEAFSKLRKKRSDVKLMIAGVGPYLDELKDISKRSGVDEDIFFVGMVQQNKLAEYYSLASIFIMPTICSEGLPLVILEAMACGKPVIASSVGGIPLLVDDKVGLLVPRGDVSALENAILNLLDNPQLMHKLGYNARNRVLKKFTLDAMVRETLYVYKIVR